MATPDVIPPTIPESSLELPLLDDPTLPSFGNYLSQIDTTSDGLHYAFIKLDASKKEITRLDPLQVYPHLRIIDVSENQISSLSPGLDVQTFLMYLNGSKNKITSLEPSTLGTKKYLRVLDLSNNEIQTCLVTQFPSVVTMNLNINKLSTFTIEDAPALSQLEIRGNLLTSVSFGNMSKLEKLYLGENQLTKIDFVQTAPCLTLAHFRGNKISVLPTNWKENQFLTYLNLRNNQIEVFEEIDKLKPLLNLAKLVLLENPVVELPSYRPSIIFRLPQVKTLDKDDVQDEEREEGEKVRVEYEKFLEEKRAREKEEAEAAAAEALRIQQEEEQEKQRLANEAQLEEAERTNEQPGSSDENKHSDPSTEETSDADEAEAGEH